MSNATGPPADDQTTGALAVVGERDGREVSFQVLQDVYNEITGKREELTKSYEIPFRITLADLQQLHSCIKQLCEQYNVTSENESVTVYHEEDSQESFSSFDRFKISDPSSLSAVESVLLKYNFLVVLPKSRRPQSYALNIRLASRITVFRRLHSEMYGLPKAFRIMGGRTAMVTVNYVDYVVARNLLDGVDRWIKGLPSYEFPAWFKFIRRRSEYMRHAVKYAMGALALVLVLRTIPTYIDPSSPDFQVLFRFSLLSSVFIFLLFRLGRYFGSQIEMIIDEATELSYISLNRGDAKRIQEAEKQKRQSFIRGVASLLSAIVLGVLSRIIQAWLVGGLTSR